MFTDAVGAGLHARQVALDGTAGSAGSSLPTPLQAKFESSLGVDLSGVRLHTGQASARAATAVSARAYAVGQDVHFSAGAYDPSSSAGQQLIAHEVAHTVQQRGGAQTAQFKLAVTSPGDACEVEADAAASAMMTGTPFRVSSAPAAIQRIPFPEGTSALMDAPEHDWRSTAPNFSLADDPTALPSLDLAEEPPGEEPDPFDYYSFDSPTCTPSPYAERPPVSDDLLAGMPDSMRLVPRDPTRAECWSSFRDVAEQLWESWNAMRPHIQQYNLVNYDAAETMRGPAGDMRLPSGSERGLGTMGGEAELQRPGFDVGGSAPTVGDLFGGAGRGGEDLHLGEDGVAGIRHAAGHLGREFSTTDEHDSELLAAVDAARGAVHSIAGARSGVVAALHGLRASGAEGAVRTATSRVHAEEARIEEIQHTVELVTEIATLAVTGGATSSGDHRARVSGASMFASMLVNAAQEDRLRAARASLDRAEGQLIAEVDAGRLAAYRQARHQLDAALASYDEARHRAEAALSARRRAYSDLGESAAHRSGAHGAARERIRAMVAAIPLLQNVVAHIDAVTDAAVEPAYSTEAGHGLGLARQYSIPAGQTFLATIASMRGYVETFRSYRHHWGARLGACEANLSVLRGDLAL